MKNKFLKCMVVSCSVLYGANISSSAYAVETANNYMGIYTQDRINEMMGMGLFGGIQEGELDITGNISRQDLAIIMAKSLRLDHSSALEMPNFSDVAQDQYSFPYIAAAVKAGLIQGTSNGAFNPSGNVTQEQLASIFVQALKPTTEGTGGGASSDIVSSWARDALAASINPGLITGNLSGTFNPQGRAEQQDVVDMASRFLKARGKSDAAEPAENTEGNENKKELTREDFAMYIAKMNNLDISSPPTKSTFSDISPTSPAFAAVEAVVAAGLMKGYENGAFGKGDSLTNKQMVLVFGRSLELFGIDIAGKSTIADELLTDNDQIKDEEVKNAAGALLELGIMHPIVDIDSLDLDAPVTYGSLAIALKYFLEEKEIRDAQKPVEPKPVPKPEETKPAPTPEVPSPNNPNPEVPNPGNPNPVEPNPGNPNPVEPNPGNPNPVEPNPGNPNPVEPNPDNPNPVEPNPNNPNPVEPNPDNPNPVEPNPNNPNPVEPNPGNPNPVEPNPNQNPNGSISN